MKNNVEIDLDAVNPLEASTTQEPQQVEEVEVVFVPFIDFELRVNQTTKKLRKGVATRLSRDEARICLDADRGYLKE